MKWLFNWINRNEQKSTWIIRVWIYQLIWAENAFNRMNAYRWMHQWMDNDVSAAKATTKTPAKMWKICDSIEMLSPAMALKIAPSPNACGSSIWTSRGEIDWITCGMQIDEEKNGKKWRKSVHEEVSVKSEVSEMPSFLPFGSQFSTHIWYRIEMHWMHYPETTYYF